MFQASQCDALCLVWQQCTRNATTSTGHKLLETKIESDCVMKISGEGKAAT